MRVGEGERGTHLVLTDCKRTDNGPTEKSSSAGSWFSSLCVVLFCFGFGFCVCWCGGRKRFLRGHVCGYAVGMLVY